LSIAFKRGFDSLRLGVRVGTQTQTEDNRYQETQEEFDFQVSYHFFVPPT
jgi:hypothetical protein